MTKAQSTHDRDWLRFLASNPLQRGNFIATTTNNEVCEALSNPARNVVYPNLIYHIVKIG
jgi:hypothetical protein